eukprot:TRINITY_DN693_c0_g1_i4.p2 TRINITY_DN693_c0_g1~~TRINITY_DN693_c0_g1_i4.p2  ORF type:complete len:104 (+),score=9.77 TRINITY_DN693_c0_g1_i4:100-411(+)
MATGGRPRVAPRTTPHKKERKADTTEKNVQPYSVHIACSAPSPSPSSVHNGAARAAATHAAATHAAATHGWRAPAAGAKRAAASTAPGCAAHGATLKTACRRR